MVPYFSIGVTTFNRPEFLKECLQSILTQTYADFEIIVGNDYQGQPITGESLGFIDPRIIFINHPENIGPIKNANYLLNSSKGKYFTWLADDDVYEPGCLQAIYSALLSADQCRCVFTSYRYGLEYVEMPNICTGKVEVLDGAEFLRRYLAREIRTLGCYAVYEADYIRQLGGMKHLGSGKFSPYSDNLLVIQSAALPKVAFIPDELVFYRTHSSSNSNASDDVGIYVSAQRDYLTRSIPILSLPQLSASYASNAFALMKWCHRDFNSVVKRAGSLGVGHAEDHAEFNLKLLKSLKRSPYFTQALVLFVKSVFGMFMTILRMRGRKRT